jgi:hypothetical protein
MSTVLEILKAGQELPELQGKELVDRLVALKPLPVPYVVEPLPLGWRQHKLPSHILELETEEFIRRADCFQ